MMEKLRRPVALLQIALVLFSVGCAPTQPYFLRERGKLAHYIESATAIEYPDVDTAVLEDVKQALPPLSLENHEYELWDLTLEECVAIALHNAKILPTTGGTAEQRQNIPAQILSSPEQSIGSVYDVGITSSTTQSFPLTIDGAGNRTLPRGALRANQVGGVEDALSEFDAQVSSFLSYNTTDRPRNTQNSAITPQQFRQWDGQQQLAISKRMATGGVASLRQQTLYSRNNIQPGTIGRNVPSDWTVVLEAAVQHPLMRNRGTLINRIPVVLAATNEDITIAEFEGNVRNLVRDVENAYWDLYLSFQAVETESAGSASSQATARFAQAQFEAGNAASQDVKQAEGQYFQFFARKQAALGGANVPGADPLGVYGRERDLRFKMGLAPTDGRLIRPTSTPTIAHVRFNWYDVVPEAMLRSPELRQQQYEIKQRELEIISAKNQLLPDLDLSLTYRWLGLGDQLGPSDREGINFPNPGSSALAELTEGNYQEGGIRLDFTPPALGARRELTRIRGAQLAKVRAEEFLRTQELALSVQLSDALAKLDTHYRLTETNFQNWAATEEEVAARLAEFQTGRADINVVLQSQLRRANAQLDYYRALVEYNKSICYVHYLKGTLLDYNNIALQEGPWTKKAYWDALERARERDAGTYLQYGWTRPNVIRKGLVPQGTGLDATSDDFSLERSSLPRRGEPTPADALAPEEANEAPSTAPAPAIDVTQQSIGSGIPLAPALVKPKASPYRS